MSRWRAALLLPLVAAGCRSVETVTSETVRWKTDTVVVADWRRDTVKIIDSGDTVRVFETRWRDRVMWRSAAAADTVVKTVEVKSPRKEAERRRPMWWLWLLVGAGCGVAAPFVLKIIMKAK